MSDEKLINNFNSLHNLDTYRNAGEINGWKYYHVFKKSTVGKKLGLPIIIKIRNGIIRHVNDYDEIMKAVSMEIELTKQ